MINQAMQKENMDVLVKRVNFKIKRLVETADEYTRDMNEDYIHFFSWNAENMYKIQFELREYRKLREVINTRTFDDVMKYLAHEVKCFTDELLNRNLRRCSTSETSNIAFSLELEVKQQLRQKFEMYIDELVTK